MNMHQRIRSAAAAALALGVAAPALAQSAGTWMARLGVTQIKPEASSATLSAPSLADTRALVKADTQPTGGITYMLNDQIALDLPFALGFKHNIMGAGAIAGVGKIGEVRALPITALAQYRFMAADAPLRPYLGIGPTYARFYKARSTAALTALTGGTPATPTTIDVESKFTFSVQAGLSWAVTPKVALDISVVKTALKPRTTLSTGQTLDAKLDPRSLSMGVSMKF